MKLIPKTFLIVMLVTSAADVCAQQQPRLKGKVGLVNPLERGIQISISVRDRDTGQLIPGEQPFTKVEDWFHVANLNAHVDVEFDGGKCYKKNGHSQIRVSRENEDLPKVTLLRTRECRLQELRLANRSASTSTSIGTRRHTGGAKSMELPESVAEYSRANATADYLRREAELIPSVEELRRELEEEAAHARNGEFFDTFQYKFALSSELYRDRRELIKVLTDFRAKKENAIFFRDIGQVKAAMFTDVVRRELGDPDEDVNLDNVLAVVREEAVSPNSRGGATVALLNGRLSNEKLVQMRRYYRQQSPSSPIFANSLIALARIGAAQDQAKLYSYINDNSGETQLIAMEALYLATRIKGPNAFPGGAETLAAVAANRNQHPVVRAFAFHSLRSFVDGGNQTAFKALIDGIKDPSPYVRVQVVLALGVGKIEQEDTVEKALRDVLSTDRSPDVREAARLSLKGQQTTEWALLKFASIEPK